MDFVVSHNGGSAGDGNLRWGGQNGYFLISTSSLRPAATSGMFYNREFIGYPSTPSTTLGVWVGTCGVDPSGKIYTSSSMAAGSNSHDKYHFSGTWRVS